MNYIPRWFFPLLFFFSGFTALIFETIWSQYLRIFLGHSAYAQSVVLVLFMGGMAAGAWLSSKLNQKTGNLLRQYAIIEASIGILGITFDSVFRQSTDLSFDIVIPMLESDIAIETYKWVLCSFLILPQTILLGMTFPNMANAAIRRYPEAQGQLIGILYFSNSAGAALGALASAFILITTLGLPGSMMTAGIINIFIALCAYLLSSKPEPKISAQKANTLTDIPEKNSTVKLLLWCAAITGAASFIYEVTWIRMLSMIIGSAFHSFEIMLSAFITGLALGGLWIRLRFNHIKNTLRYLAYVQLLMGVLAIFSLYLYNHAFELMSYILRALHRNDEGYLFYNFASHAIAFLIMLPTTTLAGMTLPLITSSMLSNGRGEKSVGQVYAANTLGAIVGILFAVHIGFTSLGIKGLIISGGLLDILIGWALLGSAISLIQHRKTPVILASIISMIGLGIAIASKPNAAYMASSVFRGAALEQPGKKIIFNQDGKTSSISVAEIPSGDRLIATNGKVDAAINMSPNGVVSPDEFTMTMLGTLPILLNPTARLAANIGLGSGLTSTTLLGSPLLTRLETIEIEKQMLAGASQFQPRVSRVFNDPRSHIIIDDARTFFSRNKEKYDLIISEPSNPWVSGVASLFTTEFYRNIKSHLNDDGLFVQWIHGYEINNHLLATIFNSLSQHYDDYTVYSGAYSDLVIVLPKNGSVPSLPTNIPPYKELQNSLAEIGFSGIKDIAPLHVAGKPILDAATRLYGQTINSDYFPVLQIHAPKQMYLKNTATMISDIINSPLPISAFLDPSTPQKQGIPTDNEHLWGHKNRFDALVIVETLSNTESNLPTSNELIKNRLNNLSAIFNKCSATAPSSALRDVLWLAEKTLPYVSHKEMEGLFSSAIACKNKFDDDKLLKVINLIQAISKKDLLHTIEYSNQYLLEEWSDKDWNKYFLAVAMMSEAASGNQNMVKTLWRNYGDFIFGRTVPFHINLIISYSIINNPSRP